MKNTKRKKSLKKVVLLCVCAAFLFLFVKDGYAAITYTPGSPNVEQPVSFTATNFVGSPGVVVWNFGDGTVVNDDAYSTHTYTSIGTFTVTATHLGETVTRQITIAENRRIEYSPAFPRPTEAITFTAINFLSSSVRWDFGDGTVSVGGITETHAYSVAGTYLVTATDLGGASIFPITVTITVLAARQILISPPQPKAGEEVTFQAVNYISSSIRWDFGDGTIIKSSGNLTKHTYERKGVYHVIAYDFIGIIEIPQSVNLTVFPRSGPRAPFSISYINLRFIDGKSYKVVPKGLENLVVEADIKFEGTGIAHFQWIVDGIPFLIDSKSLSFALEDTLDSRKTPGLPTLTPGIHEVTIRFIQPQVEFEIPVIRYYVTPEVSKKPPVNIRIVKVMDSKKQEIPFSGNSLEAPSGEYILLEGTLTNEEDWDIPRALLRIYLDSHVVDQQFITDFESKETQTFLTSILFTSKEKRNLYLILYDMSEETADLLSVRTLSITPKK